jgi:hypothetical protein
MDIEFYNMSNGGSYVQYKLFPNKPEYINVPHNVRLMQYGPSEMVSCYLVDIPNMPEIIDKDFSYEIYIFNGSCEEDNNKYIMEPYENVKVYWIQYIENGKHYDIFSKDNILIPGNMINENEIYLNSQSDDINILLNMDVDEERLFALVENSDITVYNKLDTLMYNYINDIQCGYIVQSKLSNKFMWLMDHN